MADISRITIPNGSTYDIKDATARTQISSEAATRKAADDSINNNINELKSNLTGAMHYVGVTTTPITDGGGGNYNPTIPGLENPLLITINGEDYMPKSGDVVIYQNKEFVATVGHKDKNITLTWNEFGSTGSLKALAFKDSASGSVTPSGTVSTPTFTGTEQTVYWGLNMNDVVARIDFSSAVGVFNMDTGEYDAPNGGNYGGMRTIVTPTIKMSNSGNVTAVPSFKSIKQINTVGTLPTFSSTVNDETLSFNFNAGSLPTTKDTSVIDSVGISYERPIYKVSPFVIYGIPGNTFIAQATYTPRGTISQPTFTGNASNVTVR